MSHRLHVWRAATVIITILLLAACALRPSLVGSPSDSGLLVVDASVALKGVVGAARDVPVIAATVRRPADRVSIKLSAVDGLVVFSGLKPGRYELESLSAKPGDTELHMTIPGEQRRRFTVGVEAGQVSYIGHVRVHAEFSLRHTGSEFGMGRSRATERSALVKTRGIYPGSRWDGILTRRIIELQ